MKVFHYHPHTGIYVGMSDADPSPLEPGEFLVPANATTEPVPSPRDGYDIVFDGARWNYIEQPKPAEPTDAALEGAARAKRQGLLFASDYTQLPDLQETMSAEQKAAWKEYRQALRDITSQPGFPREIAWPVSP